MYIYIYIYARARAHTYIHCIYIHKKNIYIYLYIKLLYRRLKTYEKHLIFKGILSKGKSHNRVNKMTFSDC